MEKIAFKVVQIKFLAMHITYQKLCFDIFTVGNLRNIFMEHDHNGLMIFGIKKKLYFTIYNVFLAIATNIPQQLKTGFVVLYFCKKNSDIFMENPCWLTT